MIHVTKVIEKHGVPTPVVIVVRDENPRKVAAWLYELAAKVELASEFEQWVVVVEPSSHSLMIELIDADDPAELERARVTLRLVAKGLA